MSRYTPLWLQSGSYAASVDRRLLQALWPGPATSGGAVTATTGMVLQAAAGLAAIPVAGGAGSVLCAWDAPETVTLDPAPAAGTNRIDLVIVQARGNDLDGGVNNDFVITFAKGAEAASPVAPAVPANAVALAQVAVAGGAASIVAGNITDRRPGFLSPGANAPPPPVSSGGLVTWTDPGGTLWVAKPGVAGGAYRRAADVLHARWYRAAAWSVPNTAAYYIPHDTKDFDDYGIWVAAQTGFIIPVKGLWRVSAQVGATPTVASTYLNQMIRQNTTRVLQTQGWSSGTAANVYCNVSEIQACAVGDKWQHETYSLPNALTGAIGAANTWFSVQYVGTGNL